MVSRIRINGTWYDATNVPPWYEHVVASVDGAPSDEEQQRRMEMDAEAAEMASQRGGQFIGAMILLTGLAALVILVILVAGVLT